MKYCYSFLLLLLFSCLTKQESEVLSITYLDQEVPGNSPQLFGEDIVSVKGRFDMGITISPDGKSMAFGVAHESDPEQTCIYLMTHENEEWSSPGKSFLPDNVNTFFPMFSPRGEELYFAKSTNDEPIDLWVAEYTQHRAINPHPLDSVINSDTREAGHGKSVDGDFYFTSNRDAPACCGDIYSSESVNTGHGIKKMDELNSTADEESLFLSPNGDFIIIQAWKNEFESKHDLYISYKTKIGWTTPERLDSTINGKEIEQRPFVSPDNKFLFFSRMSITQEAGQDIYESDIYWVSTAQIFKPYVFNTEVEGTVTYNQPFELNLPSDLFKDIDYHQLTYQATLEDGTALPEWITFDARALSLSGLWESRESLDIKITATDDFDNVTEYILNL